MKKLIINTFLILALILSASNKISAEEKVTETQNYASYLEGISSLNHGEGTVLTVPSYSMILNQKESKEEILNLNEGDVVEIKVPEMEKGVYAVKLEYQVLGKGLSPLQFDLRINDEHPFKEAEALKLPVYYHNERDVFSLNKEGHEILPRQIKSDAWHEEYIRDPNGHVFAPLQFEIDSDDKIRLEVLNGSLRLKSFALAVNEKIPSFSDLAKKDMQNSGNEQIVLAAEKNQSKNSLQAKQVVSRDIKVKPYDTHRLLLNVFETSQPNEIVSYDFEVEKSAYYALAIHAQQTKMNDAVYRNIYIDDKIPFQEAIAFPFEGESDWKMHVFADEEPYWIYLEEGTHRISFEVSTEVYYELITILENMNDRLNALNLELKKLLGSETDRYRDWDLSNYMPDLEDDLMHMKSALEKEKERLLKENIVGSKSEIVQKTDQIIKVFDQVLKKPNDIPKNMHLLSEGSGSIAQMSSDLLDSISDQRLLMDEIYLFEDIDDLPHTKHSFFDKIRETSKRFFASFIRPKEEKTDKLQVWVNRNRNIVEVLDRMVSEGFSKKTGIEVEISVMPDEQKLILSNASKVQPDIALGISTNMPYEFAIRNAALNLKEQDGFEEVVGRFSPGAMMSYVKDEGVYALPETQDFYVTFYRKDIFEKLGLSVPDTWDEVLALLPELQRYGMNFYTPLASNTGMKPFMFTAPFIYQQGGRIYNPENMHVALEEYEAMQGFRMMTDLFSIHAVPLQVSNFYHSFRYGDIPIGISNLADYQKLLTAAPEIAGRWDIALHPGVQKENGDIHRHATGSAQASMIFSDTEHAAEAWQFLDWWTSTETQTEFSHRLLNLYGYEYLWTSANLDAFKELPINTNHKKIILEQWEWLFEVPKVPGGYMVEREISNVWNRNVFEGENLRAALDESIIRMNRELDRKLEEFSYKKQGELIKDYYLPTIDDIKKWSEKNE